MRKPIVWAGLLATSITFFGLVGCSNEVTEKKLDFNSLPNLKESPSEWTHSDREAVLRLPELQTVDILRVNTLNDPADTYKYLMDLKRSGEDKKPLYRLMETKLNRDLGPVNIFIVGMWSFLSDGRDRSELGAYRLKRRFELLRAQLDANGMTEVQIHFIAYEKPNTWGMNSKLYPANYGDTVLTGGVLGEFCLDSFSFGFAEIGEEWFIKWKQLYLAPYDTYSPDGPIPTWNSKAPVLILTDRDRNVLAAWGNEKQTSINHLTGYIADFMGFSRDDLVSIGKHEHSNLFIDLSPVSQDAMTIYQKRGR